MIVAAAFAALLALAAPAGARPTHVPHFLHEYALPLGAYPSSIVTGPDGALWFGTYPYYTNHPPVDLGIGRITTAGVQKYFLIGKGTYDLTLGRDGRLWFTNPYTPMVSVGSLETNGKVHQYPVPSAGIPESITTGSDGDLWYTAFGGNPDIVRMDERGRTVARYSTPGASAVKVAQGPGRSIWFDEAGQRSSVGSIISHHLQEHYLGGPGYIPGPIALGPDGRMWLCDGTYVAAVTPSFGVTLYPLPNPNSSVAGIVAGPDGHLWATDSQRGEIVRIATNGAMVEYPIPTPSMIPNAITIGPDGNIWFTEIQQQTDVSKIGVLAP